VGRAAKISWTLRASDEAR